MNVLTVEKNVCAVETFAGTESQRLALLQKQKSENLKSTPNNSDSCSSAMNTALNKIREQSAKKAPKQISEQIKATRVSYRAERKCPMTCSKQEESNQVHIGTEIDHGQMF